MRANKFSWPAMVEKKLRRMLPPEWGYLSNIGLPSNLVNVIEEYLAPSIAYMDPDRNDYDSAEAE